LTLRGLVTRKELLAALVIVVWAESVLLVTVPASTSLAPYLYPRYLFGDFTYGCPSVQATTTFNDSLARWLALSCPNGPALSLIPSTRLCGYREPTCTTIYPVFTAPPGLMGLYLYPHGYHGCPDMSLGYPLGMDPLENRSDLIYYHIDQPTTLDYCAVVKQTQHQTEGFTMKWTAGTGQQQHTGGMTASVTNATVTMGRNATLTFQVTNHNTFDVTVNFAKGMTFLTPNYNSTFTAVNFNPPNATLKPGSTSSTIVTIQTSPSQVPGNYELELDAHPVYTLRFYGDYSATPSYTGTWALTYLKLTL